MFKKICTLILTVSLSLGVMAKDLTISSTVFALNDFAKVLTKCNPKVKLNYLMQNGADPHSYQGTAQDMVTILHSDLMLYIGGPADGWIEKALEHQKDKRKLNINFMDVLGPRLVAEEIKEGMQMDGHHHHHHGDHDHAHHHHDHDHDHHAHQHKATVLNKNLIDEHVWLSLKNAIIMVNAITSSLVKLDPENAQLYENNRAAYVAQLQALDQDFNKALQGKTHKSLIFADRFPFIYLMRDYNLDYFAAFPGCAAESNASFNTIAFLSQKAVDLEVDTLLTMERSDDKIAYAIQQNSGHDFKIDELNSMQAVLKSEVAAGASYLKFMRHNLEVLKRVIH